MFLVSRRINEIEKQPKQQQQIFDTGSGGRR